jgi:hypothetical protein
LFSRKRFQNHEEERKSFKKMYLVLRSEKVETPTRRRHRGPPRRRRKVSSEKRESFADSLSLGFVLEREGRGGSELDRPLYGYIEGLNRSGSSLVHSLFILTVGFRV